MVNVKIVIAEDDNIVSLDIQRVLESFGYEVPFVVSSGEEAIEIAEQSLPDLILMDISLKGKIDGIEAASKIKTLNIPVIFLTAYKNESLIQRAEETEPYGYLLKPYDEVELKLNIKTALKTHEKMATLEKIIDGTPIPLFSINNNHEVVHWNRAMEELSGTPNEDIIGTDNHWKVFYDRKRPCMVDLLVDDDIQNIQNLYPGKINVSKVLNSYSASEFFPKMDTKGKFLNFSAALIKNIRGTTIGAVEVVENK